MSRSIERVLEEAHLSGYLKLNGRKLREFPSSDKYDLNDTVYTDLSRNRFTEIPSEVSRFWCLEHLNVHHNNIKSVPDSITYLQSLVFLDLSHNQLTALSNSVFHLPLEILLVSNNKLQSLPVEIGYCKTLTELDVSCNQINRLPPQLGLLNSLRCLNIRSNLLLEIPIELTYLKLTRLELSRNRIASLPVELKNMSSSLEILRLFDNPLMAPPAVVCARGMIHVFKWLELRYSKQDKKQNSTQLDSKNSKWKYSDLVRNQVDGNNIDWNFLNIDPSIQMCMLSDNKLTNFKQQQYCDRRNVEQEIDRKPPAKSVDNDCTLKMLPKIQQTSNETSQLQQSNEKAHLQTYKEYKESLRQQRTVDSVYKCPPQKEFTTTDNIKRNITMTDSIAKTETAPVEPSVPDGPSKEAANKAKVILPVVAAVDNNNAKNGVSRTKSRTLNDHPFDKLQFTMRRDYEKAKEEAELIKQLRTTIESRLKVVLPDDLSSALNDGVVLCHFANHIMPQSVCSIHVPSPTVPKLTTGRSRRNVDNFLEACRKIGIDETLVCCAGDILEGKGLAQIAVTVAELLQFHNKSAIPE